MKAKSFLNLAAIALTILAAPRAKAINLYWDCNDGTAGFGTAGGTISSTTLGTTTSGWSEDSTGATVVDGNSYNAQSNTLIFGTNTDGLGLATGTITVDGKVSAAGNIGNLTFGSKSGVITFNGINSGVLVTGNNALGMSNVQSGGAAPGVIINCDFQAASLNSNGDNNGYVQFNGTYTGTSTITVTRGMWEHAGSSYLRSTTANTVADFTKNIAINGSTSRFKYNSTTNQVLSGNITGTNTAAQFIKANVSTLTLTGATSTYQGKFQVSGGTLSAEDDKALGNATQVTVDGGNLNVRGTTAGTVTLGTNSNLTMSSGTITLDLGTASDQIVSTGTGAFDISGGTLALNLGAGFDYGNTYQVLSGFGGTNSVSGLTFTGISGYAPALGTDGVLSFSVISGGNTYADWAVNGASFDADTNGDSVHNGLAWLLGAANKEESALDKLPAATQSGGDLILTFDCLATADRDTAVLKVQYSKDLGTTDPWTSHEAAVPGAVGSFDVGSVHFEATANGDLIHVVATIPASEAAPGTKLFGRLNAQSAP